MVKMVFRNALHGYIYDDSKSGAKYSIDGGKTFKNGGQFKEAQFSYCLGYDCKSDGNTKYTDGSDIEQWEMSVKSSSARLCNITLADNFNDTLEQYFKTTASNRWAWVMVHDDTLIAYVMDEKEFTEFTKAFAGWDKTRKQIKYKKDSQKMVKWFDSKVQ